MAIPQPFLSYFGRAPSVARTRFGQSPSVARSRFDGAAAAERPCLLRPSSPHLSRNARYVSETLNASALRGLRSSVLTCASRASRSPPPKFWPSSRAALQATNLRMDFLSEFRDPTRWYSKLFIAALALFFFTTLATATISGYLEIGRASCRERV